MNKNFRILLNTLLIIVCTSKVKSNLTASNSNITCLSIKDKESFPYPSQTIIDKDYKIVVRYTDWITNQTAAFTEHDYNGTKTVEKFDRRGHFYWIDKRIYYFEENDRKNATCRVFNSTEANVTNAYELPQDFRVLFSLDGSNFTSLLNAITDERNFNKSELMQDFEQKFAGADVAEWVACRNISERGLNIQVSIKFAGANTQQQPYDPQLKNPQIYNVEILLYKVQSLQNVTIINSVNFELVQHEKIDPIDEEFVKTPPTELFCEGMPFVKKLPSEFSKSFEAEAEFKVVGGEIDQPLTIDYFKTAYDNRSKLIAYEFDFSQPGSFDNPFYGNQTGISGRWRIVHDFNYGFEYAINYDVEQTPKCQGAQPIRPYFGDIFIDRNGTLHLNPPNFIFLKNLSSSDFYFAGKVKSTSGIPLDLYVGKSVTPSLDENGIMLVDPLITWSNETIVELYYWPKLSTVTSSDQPEQRLHSIVYNYKSVDGTQKKRASFRFFMLKHLDEGQQHSLFDISQCFIDDEQLELQSYKHVKNITTNKMYGNDQTKRFYVPLSGASFSEIRNFGYNLVLSALKFAISNAANISLLRVNDLELKQLDGTLFAYFSFIKSSTVAPAPVADIKKEISVDSAKDALNATITSEQGFSVEVLSKDSKRKLILKAEAPLAKISDEPAPWPPKPSPKPTFIGYTLSSMLIMGFFSFVFGVALVIGVLIFYQKRQQLRQMAYQVFE